MKNKAKYSLILSPKYERLPTCVENEFVLANPVFDYRSDFFFFVLLKFMTSSLNHVRSGLKGHLTSISTIYLFVVQIGSFACFIV